jgi:hypothetical protein
VVRASAGTDASPLHSPSLRRISGIIYQEKRKRIIKRKVALRALI